MQSYIVPLGFFFIVVGIPVICGTIISLAKMGRGKKSKDVSTLGSEETRIMQEIHQSLTKMEQRIEALETIIINRK